MRVPHYSGHPSIVRVWSLFRPSKVRVLTSPPSECGQTHTNCRHTHLTLPHNSSSIPLQSTRTGETYTMPYAAGELCLQHNHTPVDPHGHQCRGGCGGRLHGNCGDVEGVYPRNTTSYFIPSLVVYTTAVPPSFALLLAITYTLS